MIAYSAINVINILINLSPFLSIYVSMYLAAVLADPAGRAHALALHAEAVAGAGRVIAVSWE